MILRVINLLPRPSGPVNSFVAQGSVESWGESALLRLICPLTSHSGGQVMKHHTTNTYDYRHHCQRCWCSLSPPMLVCFVVAAHTTERKTIRYVWYGPEPTGINMAKIFFSIYTLQFKMLGPI